jgi:hypothetical protein
VILWRRANAVLPWRHAFSTLEYGIDCPSGGILASKAAIFLIPQEPRKTMEHNGEAMNWLDSISFKTTEV